MASDHQAGVVMSSDAQQRVAYQYAATDRLDARIALHRYGTHPRPWHAWVRDHLPPCRGQRVLEVGAGTGELWATTGVDDLTLVLTDAFVAMCQALRDRQFPQATVWQCRADALPLTDRSVDGVVASHMLYHLDDPQAGLRELHRVLRPGGWIVAATNGRDHLHQLRTLAHRAGVPDAAPTLPGGFSRDNGAALLAAHFTDICEHPYRDELVVPCATPVIDYLASCADRPLIMAEIAALRDAVNADLCSHEELRVTKDTALFTARKS